MTLKLVETKQVLAYVAGPMRGYDHFNFPAFDECAAWLRSVGMVVFSPAEHDREEGFDETLNSLDGFDMRAALAWDLGAILGCDVLVLLPGWEKSMGVAAELATARAAGLDVVVYDPSAGDERLDLLPEAPAGAPSGEERVTNAATGGQKGNKPARFDLIPQRPLWALAELYGRGAAKYAERNWELGYDWHLSFAAMQRHAWQFWGGEDTDPETGCPHLASVVFHAFAMLEYGSTHPELDDRPR